MKSYGSSDFQAIRIGYYFLGCPKYSIYTKVIKLVRRIGMGKRILYLLMIVIVLSFTQGCGKNTNPKGDFQTYIKNWVNKDFQQMYSILDSESKKKVEETAFVDRYKKIYEGIDVTKIDIQPKYPKEYKEENGYVSIPFEAKIMTVAGEIKFDHTAKFKKENISKDKEVWRIKWDSSMIFPDMADGDKIRIIETSGYRGAIYDRNEKPLAISDQQGKRQYPNGISSGHLTGYVRPITKEELDARKGKGYKETDWIGKSGVEKDFEEQLRPKNGAEIYIEDSKKGKKKVLAHKEAKDGENIKLTVDSAIQTALYNQIQSEAAAGVVMNPKTGEILGLVSAPSYNPQDFVSGMSDDVWNGLNNNPNKPFTNRFTSAYAPGSTFKTISAAIGLDTNKLNPNEDKQISGLTWQKPNWGKHFVKRVHEYGGGSNLRNALVYSDNIYFAKVGLEVGTDLFTQGAMKFGIGEKMPFDMSLKTSQLSNKGITSEAQLADSAYGQAEVLMNPIQMVTEYTFMSNDGNVIKPKLLLKEGASPEIWKKSVCSKENADLIKQYLGEVVSDDHGTAHGAAMPNVALAGKTGTAELKLTQDDENGQEIGWFIAFDKDNAKLSVGIMIENVKGRGGSGMVVPKVKSIFEQFYK